MKSLKGKDMKSWPALKVSQGLLRVLVGASVLVFLLFWLVGFDRPFIDDPDFNDPLFTNVLLAFVLFLLAAGVAVAVWSVASAVKKRGKAQRFENNIPVKKISYGVIVTTLLVLIATFAIGSGEPLKINGLMFTDGLWLRVADMFIASSLLLLVIAVAAIIFGSSKRIKNK